MTIASLAQSFLAVAATDFNTAKADIESTLSNPAVAAFVPVVESVLTNALTARGVPVAEIEAAGKDILAGLEKAISDLKTTVTGGAAPTPTAAQ